MLGFFFSGHGVGSWSSPVSSPVSSPLPRLILSSSLNILPEKLKRIPSSEIGRNYFTPLLLQPISGKELPSLGFHHRASIHVVISGAAAASCRVVGGRERNFLRVQPQPRPSLHPLFVACRCDTTLFLPPPMPERSRLYSPMTGQPQPRSAYGTTTMMMGTPLLSAVARHCFSPCPASVVVGLLPSGLRPRRRFYSTLPPKFVGVRNIAVL